MIKLKEFIKGIILQNNTIEPSVDKEGSIYVFSGKLKAFLNSALRVFVTEDQEQSLSNKTINADVNIIQNIDNEAIANDAAILESKLALDHSTLGLSIAIGDVDSTLDGHILDNTNPHSVTKSQVLTGNLINNDDIALDAAIDESKLNLSFSTGDLDTEINDHILDNTNPHSVTKDQVLTGDLIDNDDVFANANISESKLDLDYSTSSLHTAVNNISNANIVVDAAIVESKLALDHSTQDLKDEIDSKPIFSGSDDILNNQTTSLSIVGLNLPSGTTRAGKILISAQIMADNNVYETFDILAIRRDSDWIINTRSVGDISGIEITVTPSGQFQYKSSNYTGFLSGKFSWVIVPILNP